MKTGHPFTTTTAKIVELIEVTETIGAGTEENPGRVCRLWFTRDGHFTAIDDPYKPHERSLYERSKGM